jgi:hypothetical protein
VEDGFRNMVRGPPLLQKQVAFSCTKDDLGYIFITKYRDIILYDNSHRFSLRHFHVTADSEGFPAIPKCP